MHKYFGELLIEEKKLSRKQVKEGLKLQKDNPERKLGEILVTLNYIRYEDIIGTLKKQFQMNGVPPVGVEKWLSQEEIDSIIKSIKKE
ncbi:MAG: hypothetical protein PHF84_04105 [bacterium]|nr:hypothetical protein [bacterium]